MINKNILWLDVKDAAKKLELTDREFVETNDHISGNQYLMINYQKCTIAIIDCLTSSSGKVIKGIQHGQKLKPGTIIPIGNQYFDECFCFTISGNKIFSDEIIQKPTINQSLNVADSIDIIPKLKIKANHNENIEKIIQKLKESRNKTISNKSINHDQSINLNEVITPLNTHQNTQSCSRNLNETVTINQNKINLNKLKWQDELYSILF